MKGFHMRYAVLAAACLGASVGINATAAEPSAAELRAELNALRERADRIERLIEKAEAAEAKAKAKARHPRYADPLRNLPAWEWEMMEAGKSSKEIEAEWDRRYASDGKPPAWSRAAPKDDGGLSRYRYPADGRDRDILCEPEE